MKRLLGWWWQAPLASRRSLLAASLGWMLDSFDVMLYSLVLTHLMKDLSLGKAGAGFLASLTLIASALGGMVFGPIADRYGRTLALRASILLYSLFTALCGLARSGPATGCFPGVSRFGHGRRMGQRCCSGFRDLAGRAPRQSVGFGAEFLGCRLRRGSAGQFFGATALGLAGGFFCGRTAGAPDFLGAGKST